MLRRFAFNAGANILSGAVAAAFQLTITGMASRTWHGAEFASWGLALSVAAIAPIFASNLSSVVARRVVEARHSKSCAAESAIVLAGRRLGKHLTCMELGIMNFARGWDQQRAQAG